MGLGWFHWKSREEFSFILYKTSSEVMFLLCTSTVLLVLGILSNGERIFSEQKVVERILNKCRSDCSFSRPVEDPEKNVTIEMMIRLVEVTKGDPKTGEFTLRLSEDYV